MLVRACVRRRLLLYAALDADLCAILHTALRPPRAALHAANCAALDASLDAHGSVHCCVELRVVRYKKPGALLHWCGSSFNAPMAMDSENVLKPNGPWR